MSWLNQMSLHHPEAAAAIQRDLAMAMASGADPATVAYSDVTENHFLCTLAAGEDDTEGLHELLYQSLMELGYLSNRREVDGQDESEFEASRMQHQTSPKYLGP